MITHFSERVPQIDLRTVGRPGIWLLHGAYAYAFGCARRWRTTAPMALFCAVPSTGRFQAWAGLVEVVPQRGPAGDFLNVTWPGFAGVLTAVAPGRFAASINQAPMRRRTTAGWLLRLDYALNALAAFFPAAVRHPNTPCGSPSRRARRSIRPVAFSKRRPSRGLCFFS